ncbi:1-deoxy-D-xylulose-5-phosphate synthase [Desulfoferrobacter suflitae]|uniref:1-deoxy-D-xylulose-5-phosphate synthase n=1 Tax=Desulfoferrobacter suflitae TaxID=2865782 RepID=UPI0021642C5F|nr:1-deoxy-D-xylulose-5-phosphate synthase [Desulfoferrobacter suflitae]MCK8602717.1 1-deoxy-D-xylulose-5-phosphate synthase [Desulfoferrobacter suflitae]
MKEKEGQTLLSTIDSPAQLKELSLAELSQLAQEIRDLIICTVAQNGGHLAPNLGVVELTLALHHVFDTPQDRIIWDVGHQAYAHKILTGRREQFATIRQFEGLSGFPKRSESKYDAFGAGHASTSISAALGMAVANSYKATPHKVIAVIGDGSMTGGMAFEALNHAGDLDKNLIVILNDNEMSISPNVGALSSFLSRKLSHKTILYLKREMENILKSIPGVGPNILQIIKRSESSFFSFFTPGMLFHALKFHYIGPIKGHRMDRLVETLQATKHIEGPVLVHVMTQKGRGYEPAECDPTGFHGVGSFDIETGESCKIPSGGPCPPSYTKVFGETMVRLAEQDPRVIAITAAMPQGTGLDLFAEQFPERFFDVGIAEQHAVTFAAGLAAEGYKPVVAVYSTFLQRSYDQIIHDVCLQNLPVIFAMDRGGLVGDDGPTHHGVFDLSFLRSIPNMVLMAPRDEKELQNMLKTAVNHSGPIALRYPRGNGTGVALDDELQSLPIGKGEIVRAGDDVLLIAVGSSVQAALEAADRLESKGIDAAVLNARFVKPLDQELILSWAKKVGRIITIEENVLQGGFGSAVLEMFQEASYFPRAFVRKGLPDAFVQHGSQSRLRNLHGIDAEGIEQAAEELVKRHHGQVLRAIGQTARR